MADVFPMGIDYERFHNATSHPDVRKEEISIREKTGNTSLILSIDRLDYTKGWCRDWKHTIFDKIPTAQGKSDLSWLKSSRAGYHTVKRQIDELIGRINGKYGVIGGIGTEHVQVTPSTLAPFTTCDIALVTPLRDGMNLVAKEFVASKITVREC